VKEAIITWLVMFIVSNALVLTPLQKDWPLFLYICAVLSCIPAGMNFTKVTHDDHQ